MKSVFIVTIFFIFFAKAHAENAPLDSDFSCFGRINKDRNFSVQVVNYSFAKEVVVMITDSSQKRQCIYNIKKMFDLNKASAGMYHFELVKNKDKCLNFGARELFMDSGFIKLKNSKQASILVFSKTDTRPCEIKTFRETAFKQ